MASISSSTTAGPTMPEKFNVIYPVTTIPTHYTHHLLPLTTFAEMWYQIFLCAVFSSIFVHVIAAAIAFATLRKHKFGKFFPIFILVMGLFIPVTSGSVSSAAIAFVYRASGIKMSSWYPVVWGVGHTLLAACIGFTRILATL